MLQEEPGIELVGEVVDVQSLLDLSAQNKPDLILVDRELPGGSIEERIKALHLLDPKPIVIVMSNDPGYGRMLLSAGADAFVSKREQPDWLLRPLHQYMKEVLHREELRINAQN